MMDRTTRLAMISKLAQDNERDLAEIAERRERRAAGDVSEWQSPQPGPPLRSGASAAQRTMDTENAAGWENWLRQREELLTDGAVAYVQEQLGPLRDEIAALRTDIEILRSVVKSNIIIERGRNVA